MFIDEAIITVKAGDGGDGAATFRREKSVQFGGPDGGDGGHGGDIIFRADNNINTLVDFKYKRKYEAERGISGAKKKMHGKRGEPLVIKVPIGTQVRDLETGHLLLDLQENHEERILLKGGRGGKGNVHFKNAVRKAPKIAGKGKEGYELEVKLELKLIADVALVGYPSVGKSSFINRVSAAKSKVANYHFTTLSPKLGVVRVEEGKSFLMADIPGLIEGAHEGVGLGDKFLKHIERCKMIYHIVDVASLEGRSAIEDFEKINEELQKFSPKLAEKKQIVIANKMDLLWEPEKYDEFKDYIESKGLSIYPVSVMMNDGLKPVVYKTWEMLGELEREVLEDEVAVEEVLREIKGNQDDFVVTQDPEDDEVFILEGRIVDQVLAKYVIQIADEEALINFLHMMKNLGMEEALEEAGIQDGDTVRIANVEFEYWS